MAINLNHLPPPPKFGSGEGGFPTTVSEITQFIRWLVSLWRKADNSTTDQQVSAYIPQAGSSAAPLALQTVFGLTSGRPILPTPQGDQLGPHSVFFQRGDQSITNLQNTADLALVLASRALPVVPMAAANNFGVGLQCLHTDRIAVGTGNIVGSTLTAASGPAFSAGWVGSQIAIGSALFIITGWTSTTIITLGGAPPAGAVAWVFMLYPANHFIPGSQLIETDRTVTYRIGLSTGTCNVAATAVTWNSGPKFSPYWAGLTININGGLFTIVSASQLALTLASSAGVLGGVVWSVPNSSWLYDTGIMVGAHAAIPTDLDRYTDLNFLFRDTTRLVTYIGVDDAGVGGFYFAWFEGVEAMTLAACVARTFRASDNGYEVWISDFGHLIVWSGTAFGWGPGEGSAYIVMAPGAAPQGGPWAFCDGSAANVLKIVAGVPTSVSVTTPDMRSDTFARGGTYTGAADAASAPTFSGAGLTFTGAALGAHTHDAPVGSVSATVGFLTSAFGTGSSQVRSVDFTTASSAANASVFKTSSVSGGTPAGTIGGTGSVGAPTVGSGAPKSMALLFYMRQ